MYTEIVLKMITDRYRTEKDHPLSSQEQLERAMHLLAGLICFQELELAAFYYQKAKSANPFLAHPELELLLKDLPTIIAIEKAMTQGISLAIKPQTMIPLEHRQYGPILTILGMMCLSGKGIAKNTARAIKFYEKAIALGNATAMNNLGYIYQHGMDVPKNTARAIALYQKAIELGNATAMESLALIYQMGDGIAKNMERAIELFEKAIELGNSSAMNNLGYTYQHGEGVFKHTGKAIALYKQAAALGNSYALTQLAQIELAPKPAAHNPLQPKI
jgi:TPR repeat protein